jgi:hypothetical protein
LCGYDREAPHHRYVAGHFYAGIKQYFRWLGGAPSASHNQDHPKSEPHPISR